MICGEQLRELDVVTVYISTGYLQLDQVRTPKHCVWGYDPTLKVTNFRSTKVGNFQSQLTHPTFPR